MPADVTQLLNQIESGDPKAAEELLPLVYSELRRLASAKMAKEKPGQTLQPAHCRCRAREEPTYWNVSPFVAEPAPRGKNHPH